ncbi:Elongation factor G C-terminus family protein [Candida albicans]|uniref:Elongation factor G C-terminus family protein n=1 Tax=Candida albicans TaxID=5476 RepID=A0A8H6F2B7_CANAX|nr:Elongation factor G C-terminus family protein [Candida albicans]
MSTKVYVDSNDLGEVSHDLTQRCKAMIVEIQDQSTQNLETAAWAKDEAAKKIIVAETPLREMIGYLSKLRALTRGRATFDMTLIGMRRAVGNRVDSIVEEYKF